MVERQASQTKIKFWTWLEGKFILQSCAAFAFLSCSAGLLNIYLLNIFWIDPATLWLCQPCTNNRFGQVALILPSESCWTCASVPTAASHPENGTRTSGIQWPHLRFVSTCFNPVQWALWALSNRSKHSFHSASLAMALTLRISTHSSLMLYQSIPQRPQVAARLLHTRLPTKAGTRLF